MTDAIAIATALARAFERHGVRYLLGGSLASTSYGEPRSTLDADFAADLRPETFESWANDIEPDFVLDRSWARAEVAQRGSFQMLHRVSFLRIDIFVPPWTGLDLWKWEHRVRTSLRASFDAVDITSPEGIVLQKLHWYEIGGRSSDRQWRDIVGVLKHQRSRFDVTTTQDWARRLQIEDLLAQAMREAGY